MSRRGNSCDNAARESAWNPLNLEYVYRRAFAARAEARVPLRNSLRFFNRERLHSSHC